MSGVQDTSVEAYNNLSHDDAVTRKIEVYDALKAHGPMCNLDISYHIGRPINTITGATLKLREQGLVAEAYRAVNPNTGARSIYWEVIA